MKIINRTINTVKKHSPEILLGLGVVGTVTSTVLACIATKKVLTRYEEYKKELELINDTTEIRPVEYTEEDAKKDTIIVTTKACLDIAKEYTPSIIVGTLSIAAILQGHNLLKKRNLALVAAYSTLNETFKRYRKNVIEKYGEEEDYILKNDLILDKIKTKDENGKTVTEEVYRKKSGVEEYSEYARFFDDGCPGWSKDAEHNLAYLRMQQSYANEMLKARGIVFLNEVYEMLGISRSKAGQIVGWVYDPKNEGDNYIDFGIYRFDNPGARNFVNGDERSILLDFNVDGVVYDKVWIGLDSHLTGNWWYDSLAFPDYDYLKLMKENNYEN